MSLISNVKKQQFFVLFLVFSFIAILVVINDRAPIHLETKHPEIGLTDMNLQFFNGILSGTIEGPYVYRVLTPYTIGGIHSLFPLLSISLIDFVLKILVLIVCQWTFFYYLRFFLTVSESLCGVFLLDILISFALSPIIGPSVTETADLINLIVFILALSALFRNSILLLLFTLFAGTVNRETTLVLLPLIIVNNYSTKKKVAVSVAAILAAAIPYFTLRLLIQSPNPKWFTFDGLVKNIPFLSNEHTMNALVGNAHVAVLLLPMILLSFIGLRDKPVFLKQTLIILPFFIVIHYLVGVIIETRLWMPLFIILIPLSLQTIVRWAAAETEQSSVIRS